MMMFDDTYIMYLLVAMTIPLLAQLFLKSTFNRYRQVRASSGMTGAQVARRILDRNGLQHVHLTETGGKLTDHYDPRSKSVRLSADIYQGTSVAAVAVAAHECGHAIQHAENYLPLQFRSTLVPVVNIGSRLGYAVILIGFLTEAMGLAAIGIMLIGLIVIFQLITLPVEFNASSRAMEQLREINILHSSEETKGARRVLTAAALTYVAALIVALAQIARWIILLSRRNRR